MADTDALRIAIKSYLDMNGMSARELALKADLNDKAVTQILNGRSKSPRGDTLGALARVMGIPAGELIGHVTRGPSALKAVAGKVAFRSGTEAAAGTLRIPELDVTPQGGFGAEGPELTFGEHKILAEWSMPGDYLRSFVESPGALRIVRVIGDSMEPEYPSGDRVLVDTSHKVPSPPGVYVVWDGFGLVLKRVEIIIGGERPRIRLSSINPAYSAYERSLDEVQINGRVVGKWMWR